MRQALILLIASVGLAACDVDVPAPDRGAQVLVCGEEIARLVVAMGAGSSVLGADSASRSHTGLSAVADLGDSCEAAPALAPSIGVDVTLLDGSVPGLADRLFAQGVHFRVLAPTTLNGVLDSYRELGSLLAMESRALILSARITRGISAIAVRRDGKTRLRVAWILDPDADTGSWHAVGASGILHELLELAGAENAFHESLTASHLASEKELVRAGAEVVLADTGSTALRNLGLAAEVRAVPRALRRLPILDPLARVEALHAILYPSAE